MVSLNGCKHQGLCLKGYAWAGVAKLALNVFQVFALFNQHTGKSVAQIVKPDSFNPRLFQGWEKGLP